MRGRPEFGRKCRTSPVGEPVTGRSRPKPDVQRPMFDPLQQTFRISGSCRLDPVISRHIYERLHVTEAVARPAGQALSTEPGVIGE